MFEHLSDLSAIKADTNFIRINERFEERKIRTWSTLDERALLFGLASRNDVSTIVEIGSFCGGSAAFLAEAMRLKQASQSVFCVDPFLGGPVWFPRGYMHSTYTEFNENMVALGLAEQVVPVCGDSASVAAVWPALPIDLVFIDGDHSLLGVISDFEKWGPKVTVGGYILIDDVDQIKEVARFNDILGSIESIEKIAIVDGVSVFRRIESKSTLAADLLAKLDSLSMRSPWNYAGLAQQQTPRAFVHHDWIDKNQSLSYELAFFSICPSGDYGATRRVSNNMKEVVKRVALEKADGALVELRPDSMTSLRVCCCVLDEVASLRSRLLPGTVVMAESDQLVLKIEDARRIFADEKLEGFGYRQDGNFFWGVFQPGQLSSEAIVNSHFRNAGLDIQPVPS